MADNPLVEWRVFLPVAPPLPPLPSVLLGECFAAFPVDAEDGVEDRTDAYLLVGASDGVGLKHRGGKKQKKKAKLEVKVRTGVWPGEGVEVEAWTKFKLGGKVQHHSDDGEEGEDGVGGGEEGPCIKARQVEELARILTEHGLLDARVQQALRECTAGAGDGSGGGGDGGREVAVAKSRLVGRLRLGDALDADDAADGGEAAVAAASSSSSIAQRLLQRMQGSSAPPSTSATPARVDMDATLLVEDCVLEIVGDGVVVGEERRRWRSYQVEGPKNEVVHFLAASPLGRTLRAFADHPGAVVAGYPAWLRVVSTAAAAAAARGAGDGACQEGTCAAMIARVTASTQFPIPPLPRNPHGGVKEHFKLKQVALVVCRHPRTGKLLAVEEQGGKGWWLPAGHVDPNETFAAAAYREALEEAGIGIKLEGVLRVEHRLTGPVKGRLRVVFYGEPIHPDAPLKSVPDEESRSARWVTLAELRRLPLRSTELVHWAEYLENGGTVYPLSLFAGEGEPVPVPVPVPGGAR